MKTLLRMIPIEVKGNEGAGFGPCTTTYLTASTPDLASAEAQTLRQNIPHFSDEAVYVYCMRRRKLIYADGFKNILGFEDAEMSLLRIMALTTARFAPFAHAVNQKALEFIQGGHADIGQYSFSLEIKKYHKLGYEVPVTTRIGVYTQENGEVSSIIGRIQLSPNLRFGHVVRYSVWGPDENLFEAVLSRASFVQPAISAKEREALLLVAEGAAFKEIAHQLGISHSAVEKRIIPLYKRFGVRSLPHLVGYAYEYGILP